MKLTVNNWEEKECEETRKVTEAELSYRRVVDSCESLPDGHPHFLPESCLPGRELLYSVTVIAANKRFGGTRTPVMCNSFHKAKFIVEHNVGDLWEYSYHLCVIESVTPNSVYNISWIPSKRYWYKWDLKKHCYIAICEPKEYARIVNWGIG